jgi:hypothetical protein
MAQGLPTEPDISAAAMGSFLAALVMASCAQAHREADGCGRIDQALKAENILAGGEPAHLCGREAEHFSGGWARQVPFADAPENALAQQRAQDR